MLRKIKEFCCKCFLRSTWKNLPRLVEGSTKKFGKLGLYKIGLVPPLVKARWSLRLSNFEPSSSTSWRRLLWPDHQKSKIQKSFESEKFRSVFEINDFKTVEAKSERKFKFLILSNAATFHNFLSKTKLTTFLKFDWCQKALNRKRLDLKKIRNSFIEWKSVSCVSIIKKLGDFQT